MKKGKKEPEVYLRPEEKHIKRQKKENKTKDKQTLFAKWRGAGYYSWRGTSPIEDQTWSYWISHRKIKSSKSC